MSVTIAEATETEARWDPREAEERLTKAIRAWQKKNGITLRRPKIPKRYPDRTRLLELAPVENLSDGATELALAVRYVDPAVAHGAVLWNRATRLIYRRNWHRSHRENDRRNQQAYRERQREKKLADLITVQAEARAE